MEVSIAAAILEHILATTSDAVVLMDGASNIVRFNFAAERIFGFAAADVLGRPLTMLMSELPANEHARHPEHDEQTGAARGIEQLRTVMGRRANGEHFQLELSVTPVAHMEVRYAALLRDPTPRVDAEQERLASVGLSASMFAHEVGNPLNNMFIHAQLLQRKIARLGLQTELGENTQLIIDEILRLMQLLHEFRGLYQPTSQSHGPVSLVMILEDVVRGLLVGEQRPITVDMQLEPGLAPVLGHPNKLKQVFLNLCKNALEAMPDGGRLGVRARVRGSCVVVEIADTGSGIPPDIDPYEAFVTSKERGSGLGLAIVRQILADHHGDICHSSEPGRGTTFEVSLCMAN